MLRDLYLKASTRVKDLVTTARANWARKQAEKISNLNLFPGEAWRAAKEVMAGDRCHHKSPTVMKMKLPNGNLATNDKQNADVFAAHL